MLPDPKPSPLTIASGTLSILTEGDGVWFGVGGVDLGFKDEWRGGEGGRVEEECLLLVNKRETEAVAVDVPDMGSTKGGVKNAGLGRARELEVADAALGGCFSRIWRSDSRVRSTWRVPDVEESEEVDNSSMGGVMGRAANAGEPPLRGVSDLGRRGELCWDEGTGGGGDLVRKGLGG